jgi:hypothetical protein
MLDARAADVGKPDPLAAGSPGGEVDGHRVEAGSVEIAGTSIVALAPSLDGHGPTELGGRGRMGGGSNETTAPIANEGGPGEILIAHAARPTSTTDTPEAAPTTGSPGGGSRGPAHDDRAACTAAQLRRFVKSRAYVPLHELRRRFGLNGTDDDVSAMHVHDRRLFVGLPPREAELLAELLGGGDIGYELLLDPACPLVVGVYPMRPVPRA